MTQNPPDLRPDLARATIPDTPRDGQPTVGMVSLGCPKALVDSERILTRLRAEGYAISPDYGGADAVIVNTSRGEVVDEAALARALKAGDIGGAGLDVYEGGEEMAAELRSLGNVVMLPHMGSATMECRVEMGEKVVLNIKTFEDGHRPPDLVVPEML